MMAQVCTRSVLGNWAACMMVVSLVVHMTNRRKGDWWFLTAAGMVSAFYAPRKDSRQKAHIGQELWLQTKERGKFHKLLKLNLHLVPLERNSHMMHFFLQQK